jgi:hypothetical protein
MFKKSLIATALVISTIGAFAQAPATPSTTTPQAKPAEVAKVMQEGLATPKNEAGKTKPEVKAAKHGEKNVVHDTAKTKEVDVKVAAAKDAADKPAKPVKVAIPAK